MTRILESDNNIEGQRVSPGLYPHVSSWYQVGWTSANHLVTSLSWEHFC